MNYFRVLSFTWAGIAIISRLLMIYFGDRWNDWELNHAYKKDKPKWLLGLYIGAIFIIGFSWYQVYTTEIAYGWVITLILTLTLIKIGNIVFNYNQFHAFATKVLNNPSFRNILNLVVLILAFVFISMGLFLY